MKYLLPIFIAIVLQSCFGSPAAPSKPEGLTEIWRYEHGIVGDAPPVVSDDMVFASGGLYLYAITENTGEMVWKAEVDNDMELQGHILLNDDRSIVACHRDGDEIKIRSWHKVNGVLEWERVYIDDPNSQDLEPVLLGGHTVIGEDNSYAFVARNSEIFILNERGEQTLRKKLDNHYSIRGIAYTNGKLLMGQGRTIHGGLTLGRITALDTASGDSLWAYDTEDGGFLAPPIVEDGVMYAGAVGNSPVKEFVALDAETGEVIWRQTDWVRTDNFLLGPKYIYVNTGASLAALDKTDGHIVWRFEWESSAGLITPVYLEGYVYHSDHGRIFVLDAETGELVHEEPLPKGGGYFWHLAVSEDKLFAQTSYQLIAYEPWHLRD
jgi:outer membrane protein assembly factor BamB